MQLRVLISKAQFLSFHRGCRSQKPSYVESGLTINHSDSFLKKTFFGPVKLKLLALRN